MSISEELSLSRIISRGLVLVSVSIIIGACSAVGSNGVDSTTGPAPVVSSVPASVASVVLAVEPVLEEESAASSSSLEASTLVPAPTPVLPVQPELEESLFVATDDKAQAMRMAQLLDSVEEPLSTADSGYYMDVQYANLQQKLNAGISTVGRDDNKITIFLSGDLSFDADGISPVADKALGVLAAIFNEYDKTLISVEGHTVQSGNVEPKPHLAEQRALVIARYLRDHQVATRRIVIRNMSVSAEKNAQNGGVELILEPVIGL